MFLEYCGAIIIFPLGLCKLFDAFITFAAHFLELKFEHIIH